jgi:putative flippase GtrA
MTVDTAPAPSTSASVTQFARFVLVGVSNTVISFLVYRILLAAAVPYVAAAPAAFAAGATNGYVLNRIWTFAAPDTARSRARYLCVAAMGALSLTLLVVALVDAVGTGTIWAYVIAIPPVTAGTFFANRVWTFASPGSVASGP